MRCFHPKDVKNPSTGHWMQVRCGHCPACYKAYQRDWALRLKWEDESQPDKQSYFITLTFDDNVLLTSPVLPYYNRPLEPVATLNPSFLALIIKRIRRKIDYHSIGSSFRFFACGEYGDRGRAHYHLVWLNSSLKIDEVEPFLQECWPYGFITVRPVTDYRLLYVAKYACKALFEDSSAYSKYRVKPFASMSRGRKVDGQTRRLGYQILNDEDLRNKLTSEKRMFYTDALGQPYNLPRFVKSQWYNKYDIFLNSQSRVFSDPLSMLVGGPRYIQETKKQILKDLNDERLFYKRLEESRKF